MELQELYEEKCRIDSDINQHIHVFKKYAEECDHITEMGTRAVVSTYGFLMGKPKRMVAYDIDPIEKYGVDRIELKSLAAENGIDFDFIVADTLTLDIEATDLLFIDTYHAYPQLRAELLRHGNKANKYIIMHDTTFHESKGEKPAEDGLWRAILEFTFNNRSWVVHEKFANNNGITILKRIK